MLAFDTYWTKAQAAASYLGEKGLFPTDVVIQCGSGIAAMGEALLHNAQRLSMDEVPHMPVIGVTGHGSEVLYGDVSGLKVTVFSGRVHVYEGYTPAEAGFPAAVAKAMGAKLFICTNAAGSLNTAMPAGTLLIHSDYINNQGDNPLLHLSLNEPLRRFVNVIPAYHPTLSTKLMKCLTRYSKHVGSGVYVSTKGPVFESRAEIAMMQSWRADAVGMSTVPEVIVCHLLKQAVLGISILTNETYSDLELHASDVFTVANEVAPRLAAGLRDLLADTSWHMQDLWPMCA